MSELASELAWPAVFMVGMVMLSLAVALSLLAVPAILFGNDRVMDALTLHLVPA